jgi:hypothetical protein
MNNLMIMTGQTTLENISTEGEIMSNKAREHQYRRSNNAREHQYQRRNNVKISTFLFIIFLSFY